MLLCHLIAIMNVVHKIIVCMCVFARLYISEVGLNTLPCGALPWQVEWRLHIALGFVSMPLHRIWRTSL